MKKQTKNEVPKRIKRLEARVTKAEYEKIHSDQDVIFWSFSQKDYQKTNWWSKTACSTIKDKITIRTANTVKKIVEI